MTTKQLLNLARDESYGELTIVNKSSSSAELMLYGSIGEDGYEDSVTAKQFDQALKDIGRVRNIKLRINSNGGSVTEARAMYNMLVKNPANINVEIEGIAASAATFLAMAGDTISIGETDLFMIHNASAVFWGIIDEDIARDFMQLFGKINNLIVDIYHKRTGVDRDKIRDWMKNTTYFTGKEALENGFVDTVVEDKPTVSAYLGDLVNDPKLPDSAKPRMNKAREIMQRQRIRPNA